jgi:type IV pilus assembly protein PilX
MRSADPVSTSAQRGAVLLLTMVILILVTLLGVTAMKTSLLQEKMSGGNTDKGLAFQAAEMALRDAESHITTGLSSASPFSAGCEAGLCLAPEDGSLAADTVDWDSDAVLAYGDGTGASDLGNVATQPRYIIEMLPRMPAPPGESLSVKSKGTAYRITALGFGRQPGTRVMLQTTFYKP